MSKNDDKGCWKRQKILGDGSFGIVELWQNDYTKNTIALKKCKRAASLLTDKQRQRWSLEVKMMTTLRHPNIVGTVPVPGQLWDPDEGIPVLCMEYCSRGDLRKMLDETKNCCGIEETEALRIIGHVSSAVEYLHSGKLAHRDLKPENIVAQVVREKVVYKLTDLGYARELGEESLDGSVVGTRNYLAPELLWKPSYNCSVDYWSLGILFYEVITGHRPFFPNLPITENWIRCVRKKKFRDICTIRHGPDGVAFGTQIEPLTTLSNCMNEHLTAWFRVALQWDPKRRGKSDEGPDDPDELVVFTMLKRVLKLQIVNVFVVNRYTIDSYAVCPNTSVRAMRQLIRDRTKIDMEDIIITDHRSNVIDDTDDSLFSLIEPQQSSSTTMVPNLVVFQKNNIRVDDPPKPEIPSPVQQMIDRPRDTIDHETMKRYYEASLFFIKRQHDLFRSYVIAMSIKIDLSNSSLELLRDSVQNLTTIGDKLINDLSIDGQSIDHALMSNELKIRYDKILSKTEKLIEGTREVNAKLDDLESDSDKLKVFSDGNWLEKWMKRHDEATTIYESILNKSAGYRESPVSMVRCLHQALRICNEELRSPEIEAFVCDLTNLDANVVQLRESLTSFHALVDTYRQNFDDIIKAREVQTTNVCTAIDSMTENDTEMFESIVLAKLTDSALNGYENQFADLEDIDSCDVMAWL